MSVLFLAPSTASERRSKTRTYALLHFYKSIMHNHEKPEVLGGDLLVVVKAKDRTAAKAEAFEAIRQASHINGNQLFFVKPVFVLVPLEDVRGVSRDYVQQVVKQEEIDRQRGFSKGISVGVGSWEAVKDFEGKPLTVIDIY